MTPKVSICIPAYRQTEFLARTLDSISHQHFQDYEVVISDDSPDAVVESLVREYDFGTKLRYIRNAARMGSPANWNQAVRCCRGEYVKMMHHDDWFASPTSLGQFVALLDNNTGAGFAFSGALARVATSAKTWHHYASRRQLVRLRAEPTSLFYGNIVGPPSATIVRRASFRAFPEDLMWLVDIAQYMQILQETSCASTQEPLIVCTTQAAHQISRECANDEELNLYEYFSLFERIQPWIPPASRAVYAGTLLELVYRCNVRVPEDIRRSGYQGEIPQEILASLGSSALTRFWKLLLLRLARRLRH